MAPIYLTVGLDEERSDSLPRGNNSAGECTGPVSGLDAMKT
jgi:hypothetical protein